MFGLLGRSYAVVTVFTDSGENVLSVKKAKTYKEAESIAREMVLGGAKSSRIQLDDRSIKRATMSKIF